MIILVFIEASAYVILYLDVEDIYLSDLFVFQSKKVS